ncbi:hypothetical protein BJ984_003443 [Herbiconiux flava]|uniref:Uncharacterized protein n=1 Tax=Herbiconiux flava TaxID=881268 RepID=A0A852SU86_9MICO|nr:hypothetical protein [Herbiconiux flava]GLK17752.1 hypothetical protein GCM10017602_22340 [Herbiconiux flava]
MSPLVCSGEALHHDWQSLGTDDRGTEFVECYHCHELSER